MKKTILPVWSVLLPLLLLVESCVSGSKVELPPEDGNSTELVVSTGNSDSKEAENSTDVEPLVNSAYKTEPIYGVPVGFNEIWLYVMDGREDELNLEAPATDICYFSADINCYGGIDKIPDRSVFSEFGGRIHLVTTCDSKSLTHFILDPEYSARESLVNQLIAAVSDFDGLQIDYELVPSLDGDNFRSFLSELKKKLPGKMLSVCVPARVRDVQGDVYDYASLAQIADRIIVMAYDEHWANSAPGPIASTDWCRRIASYSLSCISPEKLVMGVSFYGRTWGDVSPNKAWYYSGINRIMDDNKVHKIHREDGVPTFSYTMQLTVTGWFDDAYSLVMRNRIYATAGIQNVAFWRAGFEDPSVWKWLRIH